VRVLTHLRILTSLSTQEWRPRSEWLLLLKRAAALWAGPNGFAHAAVSNICITPQLAVTPPQSAASPSQRRAVDEHPTVRVETATVFDETAHSKLIHEKTDARPCSADHRRQGTLRYAAKSVQLAPIPVARE